MSLRDIARASGLSKSYVAMLAERRSWRGVTLDVADKFSAACGVDLAKVNHANRILRERTKPVHLDKVSKQVQRHFGRIFQKGV